MGAVGASLLLGSTLPTLAAERPITRKSPVSERLVLFAKQSSSSSAGEISKQVNRNFQLDLGQSLEQLGTAGALVGGGPWNNWRNGWPNWNNFWRSW